MKLFIGIVPPEDIYHAILNIQNQFGDNRVEPHITLCAPVTPIDDKEWLKVAEVVAWQFDPFTVELPATGFCGNRVLFIDIKSEGIYPLQNQLSSALKNFEPPSPKAHNKYHPHLTLGRLWCGFTKNDFAAMKKLADEFLSKQPQFFTASSLRIYHKPLNNKRWQTLNDLQFSP